MDLTLMVNVPALRDAGEQGSCWKSKDAYRHSCLCLESVEWSRNKSVLPDFTLGFASHIGTQMGFFDSALGCTSHVPWLLGKHTVH